MPKGIINQSYELRKLIIQQAERHNIPLVYICRRLGIDKDRFISGYCNMKNLSTRFPKVSDTELRDVAEMLGFEIRTQIIILNRTDQEMKQLKQELKDAFAYKEKRAVKPAKANNI